MASPLSADTEKKKRERANEHEKEHDGLPAPGVPNLYADLPGQTLFFLRPGILNMFGDPLGQPFLEPSHVSSSSVSQPRGMLQGFILLRALKQQLEGLVEASARLMCRQAHEVLGRNHEAQEGNLLHGLEL